MNRSKHIIKKDTHALVVTSKDIGMKVKAEKTEYSTQNNSTTKGRYKFFERVEHFKYFGTTLTCQIPFMKKLRTD